MIVTDRIEQINQLLPVLQSPALADLLQDRIADLTNSLIGAESEQVRGAIKELRNFINLPEQLQSELSQYQQD